MRPVSSAGSVFALLSLLACPVALARAGATEDLPGSQVQPGLSRSLSSPSPEARWRGLPLFGRELFADGRAAFLPIENAPVGPDYVLGPGDNLTVFVSGLRDTSYALTLDREGKVFLPRVGTTFLWGLSLLDAERMIRSRLGTVLRDARIQVSMGRMRTTEVVVLGAARRPGKLDLSGAATVFHALLAAGGPSDLGSLRDVRLLRGNREIARFDLYPFLLAGDRSQDARLQSGDVVFVGLARSRVGIQGEVIRPGVYENPGALSLGQLLDLCGGPSPTADLSRIRIERVDPNRGFRLEDVTLDHGHGIDPDSLRLSDFDLVTVLPLHERMRNLVTLDGYVRHPGDYELRSGMKLSELLAKDRLLPEADLEHAEFRRVDPATFRAVVRSFSVREVWEGKGDLLLEPLDAVTVFSGARLPWTATVTGEVARPGVYTVTPGERLSDLLERAGGVTARGSLRAALFLRRSAAESERRSMSEIERRERAELARRRLVALQEGDTLVASGTVAADTAVRDAYGENEVLGRVVLALDGDGRWKRTRKDPVLEDGDKLVVPVHPATIAVLGAVMSPGTLIARPGMTAGECLRHAGGTARDADLRKSYVLRANGEAMTYGSARRVEPGDAVVIAARDPERGGLGRAFASSTRFLFELAAAGGVLVAALR